MGILQIIQILTDINEFFSAVLPITTCLPADHAEYFYRAFIQTHLKQFNAYFPESR